MTSERPPSTSNFQPAEEGARVKLPGATKSSKDGELLSNVGNTVYQFSGEGDTSGPAKSGTFYGEANLQNVDTSGADHRESNLKSGGMNWIIGALVLVVGGVVTLAITMGGEGKGATTEAAATKTVKETDVAKPQAPVGEVPVGVAVAAGANGGEPGKPDVDPRAVPVPSKAEAPKKLADPVAAAPKSKATSTSTKKPAKKSTRKPSKKRTVKKSSFKPKKPPRSSAPKLPPPPQ